jgi:hypothetical protein
MVISAHIGVQELQMFVIGQIVLNWQRSDYLRKILERYNTVPSAIQLDALTQHIW